MEITTNRPVKQRKGIIVLEVSIVENFGERNLEVIVSIPGNEGILDHSWPLQYGGLNPRNWEDCVSWVNSMLWSSIQANWAQQEVLPL